jgi:hypothetical protein
MCEERRVFLDKMDLLLGNEVYEIFDEYTFSKVFRSHIPGNLI